MNFLFILSIAQILLKVLLYNFIIMILLNILDLNICFIIHLFLLTSLIIY